MFGKTRIYLDYAAATPLAPEAFKAMEKWLTFEYGNPSAVHSEGTKGKAAIDEARMSIARTMGIRLHEVTFTGSGTEANNLAVYGLLRSLVESGKSFSDLEVITTAIEHPSITEVLQHLQGYGLTVHTLPLDNLGLVDTNELQNLLNEKTALVTLAYVNSEIGVIQPVKRISRIVKKHNQEQGTDIKVHTDAAQAPLWLSCELHRLGVDLMTLDAGKFCGPKGVGILAKLSSVHMKGLVLGGGQEAGLRAGTENVAGIVGASTAFVTAQQNYQDRAEKVAKVRDEGIGLIVESVPSAVVNGPVGDERVANNINISIPGVDTEYLTVWLDGKGFAVSTKSACSGAGGGESKVVREISHRSCPPEEVAARASSTLRITLGPKTTVQNLKKLAREINNHLNLVGQLTQE